MSHANPPPDLIEQLIRDRDHAKTQARLRTPYQRIYELSLLGAGASGLCCLITHRPSQQKYVLKMFEDPLEETEVRFFNLLHGEGSAYFSTKPVNIEGIICEKPIVMPYFGPTLLKGSTEKSLSKAITFLLQLLTQLHQLHYEHTILHLDVKPHNIGVLNGQAKLFDFGNSYLEASIGEDERYKKITSLWFKPPLAGIFKEQHHSKRTDYFGLAMALLEFLGFNLKSYGSRVFGIDTKLPRPIRKLNGVMQSTKKQKYYLAALKPQPEYRMTIRAYLRQTCGKSLEASQKKDPLLLNNMIAAITNLFSRFLDSLETRFPEEWKLLEEEERALFKTLMMDFLAVNPKTPPISHEQIKTYLEFLSKLNEKLSPAPTPEPIIIETPPFSSATASTESVTREEKGEDGGSSPAADPDDEPTIIQAPKTDFRRGAPRYSDGTPVTTSTLFFNPVADPRAPSESGPSHAPP